LIKHLEKRQRVDLQSLTFLNALKHTILTCIITLFSKFGLFCVSSGNISEQSPRNLICIDSWNPCSPLNILSNQCKECLLKQCGRVDNFFQGRRQYYMLLWSGLFEEGPIIFCSDRICFSKLFQLSLKNYSRVFYAHHDYFVWGDRFRKNNIYGVLRILWKYE